MAFDQNKPANSAALVSADVRNNFQHVKTAVSKEHNWDDSDPNATTHKLDAMNLTVTGSTQGNISTGGGLSLGSNSANSVNVLTQTAGVAGGSYSVKNLLQELVNRTHMHGVSSISINCNCCNCGGGGCFRKGTKVLMADGTEKNIEDIVAGELVVGMDLKPTPVIKTKQVPLDDYIWMTFPDESLYGTASHFMWVDVDGDEYWGLSSLDEYLYKTTNFKGFVRRLRRDPIDVCDKEVDYATVSGWKKQKSIIIPGDPTEIVYHLICGGSHSYIANGYVVGGTTNDRDFDYSSIKWKGLSNRD